MRLYIKTADVHADKDPGKHPSAPLPNSCGASVHPWGKSLPRSLSRELEAGDVLQQSRGPAGPPCTTCLWIRTDLDWTTCSPSQTGKPAPRSLQMEFLHWKLSFYVGRSALLSVLLSMCCIVPSLEKFECQSGSNIILGP